MPMKRLFFALVLLVACAPTTEPERAQVEQLSEPLSFYPHETGAVWQYLLEGDPVDAQPLYQRVEGPTVVENQTGVAWRSVGRGLDVYSLKQYRDDGVFVLRIAGPGYVTTLEPPLQELPAQASLQVGERWGGRTTATVTYPEAQTAARETLLVDYLYTVVDKREVTVRAGTFEVYVINLESSSFDAQGNVRDSLHQESWFAPYVGEVRTELGYFLSEANFLIPK